MLSNLAPYILALLAALVALKEHGRASELQSELQGVSDEVREQVQVNDALAAAVGIQNQEINRIKQAASSAALEAAAAASEAMAALPKKLEEDLAPEPTPEEMNRWFEALFLP